MDLYITEEDILRNIQQQFSEVYPHLKLQFYKNAHDKGVSSPASDLLSPLLPIEEVTMFHTAGIINIGAGRTVAEIEYDFRHHIGLNVQVFRQSGNNWLETTGTDDWTLQQQEEKALESFTKPARDVEDFDLSDVG